MKAVVAAFNQEKALVGAFSVITNLRMEIFQALMHTPTPTNTHILISSQCFQTQWMDWIVIFSDTIFIFLQQMRILMISSGPTPKLRVTAPVGGGGLAPGPLHTGTWDKQITARTGDRGGRKYLLSTIRNSCEAQSYCVNRKIYDSRL